MNEIPEMMDEFFNTRADIYDVQQVKNIDGGEKCDHEIARYAGFQSIKQVWGIENNIMLLATKQEKK